MYNIGESITNFLIVFASETDVNDEDEEDEK